VALAHRAGFETRITVPRQEYLAVDSLDATNQVTGTSATVAVSSRTA
jgi:hypothetical protein